MIDLEKKCWLEYGGVLEMEEGKRGIQENSKAIDQNN